MKTSPHVFRMIRNPVGLYILSHWLFNIQEIFKFLIIVSLTDRLPTWLTDCFQLIGLKPLEDRKIHPFNPFLVDQHRFFFIPSSRTHRRDKTLHTPHSSPLGKPWKQMGFKRTNPRHPSLLYHLIHSVYRPQPPDMFWRNLRNAF